MKLEHITKETVKTTETAELKNLVSRANQIYKAAEKSKNNYIDGLVGGDGLLTKNEFNNIYEIIFDELQSRGEHIKKTDLDYSIIKRRVKGISPDELPILILKDVSIGICGDYIKNPKRAEKADIIVDKMFSDKDIEKIQSIIEKCVQKPLNVEKNEKKYTIPLYSLCLCPVSELDVIEIENKEDFFEIKKEEKTEETVETVETITNYDGSVTEIEQGGELEIEPEKNIENSEKDVDNQEKDVTVELIKKDKTINFTKNEEKRIVGGIVYEVNEIDSDNEYVGEAEEIWKGMESWMLSGHKMKFMHAGRAVDVYPVEVFQAEEEIQKGGDKIKAGSWYVTAKVLDDKLWEACKKGEITGFSMGGKATVDDDDENEE